MPTVEDVAAITLAAVDTSADNPIGLPQVGRWVEDRYRELVAKVRFRHLRHVGAIDTPAQISAGTLAINADSATLVADAAAQAAIAAVPTIKGFHVRALVVWYEITDYTTPNITIATPFSELPTSLDGPLSMSSGYKILPRFHDLDPSARWMGKFVYPKRRRALQMRGAQDFDRTAPERFLTADGPWFVAEATNNPTTGGKRVELYPYNTIETTIYYTFWAIPAAFTLATVLPQEIDAYVLREGVLIDVYRYRASQAVNAGKIDAAGYWRNEMRSQMTSWAVQIQDATKADRGQDDVSFIYNYLGLASQQMRDIQNARDQIFALGIRP